MALFVVHNLHTLRWLSCWAPIMRVKETLIRCRNSETIERPGTTTSRTITLCYLKEVELCTASWAF